MSLRFATLVLMATLAITTHATSLSSRVLLQDACTRACDAAGRTDPNTIQAIIDEGNNICSCRCNSQGWTPMHVSVESRCHECIENMVSSPSSCSKSSTDYAGNTVMHIGARLCRLGVVEELIGMGGFPIDSQNTAYNTPLCVASRQDDPNCGQIVRQLLEEGAEPCFDCSDGQTPCEGCVGDQVCDVLREDGACNCP